MCTASHFGTVFGILCAVTCIVPAGHRKTTQIKCEIEGDIILNLHLLGMRYGIWELRHIAENSPYLPNKKGVFSAVQARQHPWLCGCVSFQALAMTTATLCLCLLLVLVSGCTGPVLLCPPLWLCNYIYFTQTREFPFPFYICCFPSCWENSTAWQGAFFFLSLFSFFFFLSIPNSIQL